MAFLDLLSAFLIFFFHFFGTFEVTAVGSDDDDTSPTAGTATARASTTVSASTTYRLLIRYGSLPLYVFPADFLEKPDGWFLPPKNLCCRPDG
jgi:hypothetical protein